MDGSYLEFQNIAGVIFDVSLPFEFGPHVQNTVKTSFFLLRNIARLHLILSFSVAEKPIGTFVFFSHTDYCTVLLAGLSKSTINKLQYVQNSV